MRGALLLIVGLIVAALLLVLDTSPRAIAVAFAAALLAFPVALRGALRVSGGRLRDFMLRTLVRWAAMYVLLVLLVCALIYALVGEEPWWLAPALGWGVAGCVFAVAAALWLAPLRPVFALRAALADPERVEALAREAAESFERVPQPLRGIAARRHATRALTAVGVLSQVMRFEEAARVLDTVPSEALHGERRGMTAASRATVLLYLGDRNGAWAALKEAFEHSKDPAFLRLLKTTDALCSALDGHGREALAKLPEQPPEDPLLARSRLIVRAHALAAEGDEPGARACLEELAAAEGNNVERVRRLRGPASRLAEEMLQEAKEAASSGASAAPASS